jgi:hypothetical protein
MTTEKNGLAPEPELAMQAVPSRRQLLQGTAAVTLGAAFLAGCDSASGDGGISSPAPLPTPSPTPTPTPTPATPLIGTQAERDMLNFALNLFYLEGELLSFAVTGQALDAASISGTGTAGAATGGRGLTFTIGAIAERYREMLYDTLACITLLRELLGADTIAQPTINVGVAGGPFGVLGRRVSDGDLDPYASEMGLQLGHFYILDPLVALLKRLSWQMTTPELANGIAAICTTKAGHSGMVRLAIQRGGQGRLNNVQVLLWTIRLSDLRESLNNTGSDLDQGVYVEGQGVSLLVSSPAGYMPERTPAQTRPLFYLAVATADRGGFFPNGMNGTLARL